MFKCWPGETKPIEGMFSTYANILKYHIQGMPINIILLTNFIFSSFLFTDFCVILPDFYFIYKFSLKFNLFFKLLHFIRLILIFLFKCWPGETKPIEGMFSTYANILKYHIQGMPINIILRVFIKTNRLSIYPKPGMSHYIPCLIAE
jgi:hypothetical protein